MKRFIKPISFLIVASVFITAGQGCPGGGQRGVQLKPVTIEYWRVFDGEDDFDAIIDSYRALHPNVKIRYKKLRFDEYEGELIRAFAEGRGPDILAVHNTWMEGYKDLLMPMPSSLTITQQVVRGTVRRQVVVEEITKPTMSTATLKKTFVEQVPEDIILEYQPDPRIDPVERIYGLPLSLDSLALFYNKDLLDAAGFPNPPSTWEEFQGMVPDLTSYDTQGNILQSGAALGTSQNVERATDILSLLMMQTGTPMTDERGRVAFHTIPEDAPPGLFPGLNATEFYTDFANPTKQVYAWNKTFPNSFEAFANGQTAFFLGYSYHIPLLRTVAPRLNFAIAAAPQIEGGRKVNYANYWIESVAASTDVEDWAWDFLLFAAGGDNVVSYLDESRKPTALRNLINSQLDDEELGVFARQTLTAESWYHGKDVGAAEDALKDLIDDLLEGVVDPEDAIELAANKVQQTYKKKE